MGAYLAGQVNTITASFSPNPAETPTLNVYSDDALSVLAQTGPMTATGNPAVWEFDLSASLPAGTYYAQAVARFTVGGPLYPDPKPDVILLYPSGVVIGGVTLGELKAQLNWQPSQTDDDPELQAVLDAAVEIVEAEVGPISPTVLTENVVFTSGRGILSRFPVVEVTTTGVTLEPGGVVSGLYGTNEITYTYGRPSPTAAQRMAVLLVAQDLWESRRGQGYVEQDTGDYVERPILRRRVRELLAPTRLGPSVA